MTEKATAKNGKLPTETPNLHGDWEKKQALKPNTFIPKGLRHVNMNVTSVR